jgi:phosphohistidine phosphatase SixA
MTSARGDDPSLASEKSTCYKLLKQSRAMRIQAKPFHPSDAAKTRAALVEEASSSSTIITKIVHFQRHGQGIHNQIYKEHADQSAIPIDLSETSDPALNPFLLPNVIDARLTEKGKDQCRYQRDAMVRQYLGGVELIVVSPLVRALETACITFEDHLPSSSSSSSSATINNNSKGGEQQQQQLQQKQGVRWVAHEGIREELGLLLCNQRRPLRETRLEFPHVDFSLLLAKQHHPHNDDYEEEDVLWKKYCETTRRMSSVNGNNVGDGSATKMPPQRETMEDISHRAYDFLVDYLCNCPEQEIAVVGHSAWLLSMTNAVLELDDGGDDDDTARRAKEFGTMFGQAELRSATLTFTENK